MPNTLPQFNPAYSTVKAIYLAKNLDGASGTPEYFDIVKQNTECRFERLEMTEDITSIFPDGVVLVKDFKDIVSLIQFKDYQNVVIEFFDGSKWNMDITSVSYVTNAASSMTDTLVNIFFSNGYYRKFSSTSLNATLNYRKPRVYQVSEFVDELKTRVFANSAGYNDRAVNYFLYRPLIPSGAGDELLPDNAMEMMNYLTTASVDIYGNPNFFFWTGLNGNVNFKSFPRSVTQDSSYATIAADYRNIAVFDGESVIQKLSDGKTYRKATFYATNPAYQWISKNYYYIRTTPKYLDAVFGASGFTATAAPLAFHFQDAGQKFNIDTVTTSGRGGTLPYGGDNVQLPPGYGYFVGQRPNNDLSKSALIGNQYGTHTNYYNLPIMGVTGFFSYLDSPDMWKNMFDLTPVHPHYPDQATVNPVTGISGWQTNLQTVIDLRYDAATGITNDIDGRLKKIRQIEAQNFVMYTLCCMGQQPEDSFFALLQKYEQDSVTTTTGPATGKMYRYKWNKINFKSNYGPSGPTASAGTSGSSGASGYYFHQLEKWSLDTAIKSSVLQDDTWAINVNERGLTGTYLPPGWVPTSVPAGFRFRPIGADQAAVPTSDDIAHIVRMYRIPLSTLLTESGNQVYPAYTNKYLNYFWAENIVDGSCSTGATA